jgi:hypothetical protein
MVLTQSCDLAIRPENEMGGRFCQRILPHGCERNVYRDLTFDKTAAISWKGLSRRITPKWRDSWRDSAFQRSSLSRSRQSDGEKGIRANAVIALDLGLAEAHLGTLRDPMAGRLYLLQKTSSSTSSMSEAPLGNA